MVEQIRLGIDFGAGFREHVKEQIERIGRGYIDPEVLG